MSKVKLLSRVIAALITFCLLISVLGSGVIALVEHEESERLNWPTTRGTVTSAEKWVERSTSGEESDKLTIHYSYTVDGISYSGKQTLYLFEVKWPNPYIPGKSATVYYNPANHKTSVVNPNSPSKLWYLFIPALLIAAFGAVLAWAWISEHWSKSKT